MSNISISYDLIVDYPFRDTGIPKKLTQPLDLGLHHVASGDTGSSCFAPMYDLFLQPLYLVSESMSLGWIERISL
jgi:hypothetical protein